MSNQGEPIPGIPELIAKLDRIADLVIQILSSGANLPGGQTIDDKLQELRAIDLVMDSGLTNVTAISEQVGVSRTSMYRWKRFPQYLKYARALKRHGRAPRGGFRTTSGVEAIDDSEPRAK